MPSLELILTICVFQRIKVFFQQNSNSNRKGSDESEENLANDETCNVGEKDTLFGEGISVFNKH